MHTSGRRIVIDYKTGSSAEKLGYAVQLYAYATGVLYDPRTEQRTPFDVADDIAIIAHVRNGKCKLIAVDLTAIQPIAELCASIYEARNLDGWHAPFTSSSTLSSSDASPLVAVPMSAVTAGSSAGSAVTLSRGAQLAAVPTRTPDEGATLDEADFGHTRAIQSTLTADQRAWLRDRVQESMQAKVSIHTSAGFTARRLAAIETLLASACRIGAGRTADDVSQALRVAIADLVDADWPRFPNVTVGHALGVLNVDEIELLAKTVTVLDDTGWATLAAA